MNNCIFCKINNKEAPAKIVFENDDILAFVPIQQVSKGHTLVVPKNHFENIFDIDKNGNITILLILRIKHRKDAYL